MRQRVKDNNEENSRALQILEFVVIGWAVRPWKNNGPTAYDH